MDKSFPCFGIKVVLFFFHICGCPLVVKSKLYSLANKPGTYARWTKFRQLRCDSYGK
jgi:hypothetical protein